MNSQWHHGRPIRGFIGGFLVGIGGLLILHQFGLIVLEMPLVLLIPWLMAVFGGIRGWLGTPYSS